ncbi:FK506-binding protein 2A [Podochytrium sp. JEL0797]|nr:FK506-binding protein 2A [Podochytrium sp. JEL0797]
MQIKTLVIAALCAIGVFAEETETPKKIRKAPTSLQIGVLKRIPEAECPRRTRSGDKLAMHYTGTLFADGSKFDSSLDRGQPFEFTLGQGQVIKGWDNGLMDMCIGEKRKLIIPPALGYGDSGAGAKIPGGASLIFTVELLDIKNWPAVKTRVICVALDESKVLFILLVGSGEYNHKYSPLTKQNAEAAFTWAKTHLLRDSQESSSTVDEVVLLHCRAPPASLVFPQGDDVFGEAVIYNNKDYAEWMNEQSRIESHNLIKKYAEKLMDGQKGVVVRGIALVGDPRNELCEAAHLLQAEMMVVGTRGMGILRKALMGSVSDHLLHHLECPVVVVRESQV